MRASNPAKTRRGRRGVGVVILVGFMGAGKSSVGRTLGEQLGWEFEDLDDRVERREQRKVAEIFRDAGELGFRQAEHAALKELLIELRTGGGRVVALGGGAFAHEQNSRLIERRGVPTVFLDASAEELWRRCRQQEERQGKERPLLGNLDSFRTLYQNRRPHYLKASFRHETGGKTVDEIAAALVEALQLKRSLKRGEKH